MIQGRKPFQFRVVTEPLPVLKQGSAEPEEDDVPAAAPPVSADSIDALLASTGGASFPSFSSSQAEDQELQELKQSMQALVTAHRADCVERINAALRFVLRRQRVATFEVFSAAGQSIKA